MKNDQQTLEAAVQFARIQQILRDCRIAHLGADELAKVRLFYTQAGIHPRAHLTVRSEPRPCDRDHAAVPLRIAA